MTTVLTLEDIEGVGPTTANKLRKADIVSVSDLAVANPIELMDAGACAKRENADEMIQAARNLLIEHNLLQNDFITGNEDLKNRTDLKRITTGSKELDRLLGDGIESKAVTEFYGQFGSGKSQVCHTLAVLAQNSEKDGGLNADTFGEKGVIYFDTEGTFRSNRIKQICEARGFVPEVILKNIHVAKVANSNKLELHIRQLGKAIEDFNAGLVIVDSITNLHRGDFLGRGMLADRQQRLSLIMHKLVRVSEVYNVAVVITNQVQAAPDTFFGDPIKPTGGNVVGHASTYRIYLKPSGANKSATMVDSPCHAYDTVKFSVTEAGVVDVEEDGKKKKEAEGD